MEANRAASHVEFFAKACAASDGSWKRAVLLYSNRRFLTIASPICILLWASGKMQRFLCGEHRKPSFSCGRAVGALLQSQQNHLQHLIPRGGFAGPDFELPGCLMDEHFDAGNDLRTPFPG